MLTEAETWRSAPGPRYTTAPAHEEAGGGNGPEDILMAGRFCYSGSMDDRAEHLCWSLPPCSRLCGSAFFYRDCLTSS
jgi:hypothetical protein